MNEEQLFGKRPWIEASDLDKHGINVTIADIETRPSRGNKEPQHAIKFFELEKTLTLYWQHYKAIRELTGEGDTNNWTGFRLKLVPVTQVINGVEGKAYIAIEPADPEKPKPTLKRRSQSVPRAEVEEGAEIPF